MSEPQPLILTSEQQAIAARQIERLTNQPPRCVMCGSDKVYVADKMFRLELDGLIGTGAPVVALGCTVCSHIAIFSAVGLGVIDS